MNPRTAVLGPMLAATATGLASAAVPNPRPSRAGSGSSHAQRSLPCRSFDRLVVAAALAALVLLLAAPMAIGDDLPGDSSIPEREVLALLASGIIQLPEGQSVAPLAGTTINSSAVESVLESYGVESIAQTFPDFSLADTVAVSRTGETVRLMNLSEIYRVLLPEGGNPTLLAQDLAALTEDVGYADPNGYATPLCVNDPYFGSQWNLGSGSAGIKFCAARAITPGSTSTKIGIVDYGVDGGHPDLTPEEMRAVEVTLDGQRYRLRTDLVGSAHRAFAAAGVRPPATVTILGPPPPRAPAPPKVETRV